MPRRVVGWLAATVVVLAASFCALTWWVTTTTEVGAVDLRVGTAVHDVALSATWLVSVSLVLEVVGSVPFCAAVVAIVVVALVTGGGLRPPRRMRMIAAGALVASAAGGALLDTLIKRAVDRQRPPWNGLWSWEESASYPSGHAQAGITVWVAVALVGLLVLPAAWRWWVAGPIAVIGVCIGASRVVLGVHWPSDVLGGWLLGSAWLLIGVVGLSWLGRRQAGAGAAGR